MTTNGRDEKIRSAYDKSQMIMKQVNKNAYRFEKYVGPDRWASYWHQLREVLLVLPSSVLEIGVGDGVFGDHLKSHGVAYTSVDIAEDLSPDVVADVTALPFPDESFDVVCAFEILEHVPFEGFDEALRELSRVSKRHVIISLPHFGPSIRFELKIPLVPRVRFAWKVQYPKRHRFNGEHYWEVGKRGFSVRRIRNALSSLFAIAKEFVPFENQYHRFFVLIKK